MRRARVNFEIVPDEELITNEMVSIPEVIERFREDLNPEEIATLQSIENSPQHNLEVASANFRSQFLNSLNSAQNQEQIEAILNIVESQVHELGGDSFEVALHNPNNPGIFVGFDEVAGGFIPPSSIPYNPPWEEAQQAIRDLNPDLEELPDIFDPVDSEIIGEVIEIPQEAIPITRRGRRNHPTEEVPQQSINQELTPEELQMLEEAVIDAHREIPPNSGTLLVEESTSRFSGAIWFEAIKTKTVMVAGLGGIGSWLSLLLSRLQPAIILLYDDDIVETGNLSGQLYSNQNVGNLKTTSLAQMMRDYGNYHGTCTYKRYERNSATTDIMICGFDNMEARKIYFNNWIERVNSKSTIEEKKKCLYIDGRLSIEFLQIFCLTGDDEYFINEYKTKHFFSDSEANEVICSLKQTTFMANMIGSLIVNLFVNFVANECEPLIDRDVPFLTEYSAETMFLNTVH